MGIERADDAGVYRLSDDLAIVQTVDFFTPIVDDPFLFGKIAAVNALSDVYAMGGKPVCAMNVVCFPTKKFDLSVLTEVLQGGLAALREAEALLVSGHSVQDEEFKYGLAVTGTVHPDRVLMNSGARPGDALVLTKPIGTGVVTTAGKSGKASTEALDAVIASMTTLNRSAAEALGDFDVHACTDVTGFGLIGHACEMVEGGSVAIAINADAVPLFPNAEEYARTGFLCGGVGRNRTFRDAMVMVGDGVPAHLAELLHDPQTSGGLLIALERDAAPRLVDMLHLGSDPDAAVIGEVLDSQAAAVIVR